MIGGFALAAVSATSVYAQAATAPQPATTDTAAAANGELVVTGSRIPQPNLTSIAPVTSVSNAEIKLTGTTRVEDLINSLPQVVAEQGGYLANGASGTATVSLRDLGSVRTLVLIDGRRVVPGDPAFPVPDLNFIPADLIDRVEVDLAGASSVYGSDAVAGVVNFVMKHDFEGLRLDANYGLFQHDNNNSASQAANRAKGFPLPKHDEWDGYTRDVSVIFGANSPDGKGNVEGYISYRSIDPVLQGKRDYSTCTEALNAAKTGFNCSGSGTAAGGQFLVYGPNFTLPAGASSAPDLTLDTAHPGNFRNFAAADVFNFGALNYFQRPDVRYSGGFFAHYDITPMFKPYAQFMFMDDHTVAQIAPSGAFFVTATIPCSDPLLSANELQAICGQYGLPTGPGSTAVNNSVIVAKRNVEGGNRQDDLRHTDYRAVIGVKGDLGDNWHYDAYYQYGASVLAENYLNDVSKVKILRSLNVVPDPVTGAPVCASFLDGTDKKCVPWNLFTPGGVTPAAAAYLNTPGFQEGQTTEQVLSGSITGDLAPYGLKSPWANDGFGVALGAEYRKETLDFRPDVEFQTGDLAGQGGPINPVSGSFDVKELFGEARIPIVQDAPMFKNLSAELGYRYSHYSSAGNVTAYKITGDWSINDDFRVRGGFNRSVRAPNIDELFTPQGVRLDGNTDGCTTATPVFTAAQCANTGVTAAQYGHLPKNPANQYNGLTGGNPALKPETANTYSVGVVFTPHEFVRGFSASADYFNIKITNVIQGFGADNILDTCATTGAPAFCNLVHRSNIGSLWLGTNIIGAPTSGYVIDTNQNGGYLKTSGVDFAANYRFNFHDFGAGELGGISIDFLGTYTHDYQVFSGIPGSKVLQCVGNFGTKCQGTATPQSGPLPSWRHKVRLSWQTPVDGLEISGNWRFIGAVKTDTGITGRADSNIPAFNYFDLAANWRVRDRYTFRLGVNNVFDKAPPIIGSGECPSVVCSGNTFPQIYDPLGRYLFVGMTADF